MTTYVSATGAKAALLKGAGKGLLDEELMETVAKDMGLIGDSMTRSTGGLTETNQKTDALQKEVVDMAGKLDDQGVKATIDVAVRKLSDQVTSIGSDVEGQRSRPGQDT